MGRYFLGVCFLLIFSQDLVVELNGFFVHGSWVGDEQRNGRPVFNVESYGAVGDGVTDDTEAFMDAWGAVCSVDSAILHVPRGKTFFIKPSTFQGPCASRISLRVDGTLVAPEEPRHWKTDAYWVKFTTLKHFNLDGKGTLIAQGHRWWNTSCSYHNHKRTCGASPTAVCFEDSENIKVKGLKIVESPHFHLQFLNCNRVSAKSIQITAPHDSPNTDGIHLDRTGNVRILDSVIEAGDDCISVGHGSYNVNISGLTCGPGHGISVGSLGESYSGARVHNILVDGATLTGTENGLRIKTWQGGHGWARNIVFNNIRMVNVSNPIIIDQYYCDSPKPCPNRTSAVEISDITFKDVVGTSRTDVAVRLVCSSHVPCKRILLSHILLRSSAGRIASSYCHNAQGATEGAVDPPSCLT